MKMLECFEIWVVLFVWLFVYYLQLYVVGLFFVVVLIWVIYGGGMWCQVLFEVMFCILIILGLIFVFEWFGLLQNMVIVVGVFIGFLGVKKIVEFVDWIVDWKFLCWGIGE